MRSRGAPSAYRRPLMSETRSREDLHRAVRAIARHFETDTVVIIGSQAVLIDWPDAPPRLLMTPEIDMYPGNIRAWEIANDGMEASEEINALFGEGSMFDETHGFYIDGVDDRSAKLPPDWEAHASTEIVDVDGESVKAITPSPEDTAVAKMHRLAEKDREYISLRHREKPYDLDLLRHRLELSTPDHVTQRAAMTFIDSLTHPDSPFEP